VRAELSAFPVATAVVGACALVWVVLVAPRGWAMPAFAYLAVIGAALAVIDARTHRLPNVLVWPSYPVCGALLTVASAGSGTGTWGALGRAGLGALAMFAWYFLLFWINPAGIGFGDVKLAGILGAYLGWMSWATWLVGIFAGFALGAVAGIGLIVARRATRRTAIPFGPFMLAGTALAITLG
jgi:leader peptidase (prepilin peptidase)/N-methyltransferase